MRNDLRDAVVVEVKSRIVAACIRQAESPGGMPLDVLINETLYHEKKRLDTDPGTPRYAADQAFWSDIKSRLGKAGEAELRRLLEKIVDRFASEVLGNFRPWVYGMATKVLPRALPMLLNAMSPKKLLAGSAGVPDISQSILIQGRVDLLRRCQELGTVVLAPTHVSNLDSPVVGWALFEMGLPPFTYGAGLNLFSNPMVSFFMRNLGAYRVDRLKTAPLYKDVLKEYATVSLELGQSNLFFPAGTRVRSGEIESKLKRGLLSSGLRAYINNLMRERERPNIYIVPVNLNYHLVLEAETLIEDHLKRTGKSRYIISDDEFSRPREVLRFMSELVGLDSKITLTVGEALDPFGNLVDEEGKSLDNRGRNIDIRRYVETDEGVACHQPQRDRVYTTEAAESLGRLFRKNNVALSTNLVAFTAFEYLRASHPTLDLYRLLRTAGDGTGIEMGLLADMVRRVMGELRSLEDADGIRIDDAVRGEQPSSVIADALRHFGSYHTHPVLVRRGDRVFAQDMKLLLYYHNRLKGYGLERAVVGGLGDQEVA